VEDGAPLGGSMDRWGEGHLLTAERMQWFLGNYCPQQGGTSPSVDRAAPVVSPLLARLEDLGGTAPAIVVTADHDPLW
jgi:acetyl esterase/lipase